MSVHQQEQGLQTVARKRSTVSLRLRPESVLAAFGLAFALTLAVTLLQAPKPFYYDSGLYWSLASSFIQNQHFSLLNFNSPLRGYALPLINYGLQAIMNALQWSPSLIVKIFNSLILALIGAVLAPTLAQLAWPERPWGLQRRLALTGLLLVFWVGYLSFPLSDLPALLTALLALVATGRPDSPSWMLVAGALCALTVDIRPAYLLLGPIVVALVLWAWRDQRGAQHASIARRGLCLGLLVVGFAAVSLPQSLSAHRYYNTWSFVPGSPSHLSNVQLTVGLLHQRYDTYVGSDRPPQMFYEDPAGKRLLLSQPGGEIDSSTQYLGLILSHPLVMGGVFARHVINGLDQRYNTPYVEHVETGWHLLLRLAGFLLVFLALVRVAWPAARRRLGRARWRYPVALLACCLSSVSSEVEVRYLLPVYVLSYILVLAPGWPNPLGSVEAGVRRFRTPAILLAAYLAFMAVIWHVASGATSHLRFG